MKIYRATLYHLDGSTESTQRLQLEDAVRDYERYCDSLTTGRDMQAELMEVELLEAVRRPLSLCQPGCNGTPVWTAAELSDKKACRTGRLNREEVTAHD